MVFQVITDVTVKNTVLCYATPSDLRFADVLDKPADSVFR